MAFNVLKGWNMDEFRELVGFGDPEKMLLFLQQFELIATKKSCRTCHALARNAEKVRVKDGQIWRCFDRVSTFRLYV